MIDVNLKYGNDVGKSKKHREISKELLQYIKNEIETTEFGDIIIKVQGNNKIIDVISQGRKRFQE
jgi:hypothetical protein